MANLGYSKTNNIILPIVTHKYYIFESLGLKIYFNLKSTQKQRDVSRPEFGPHCSFQGLRHYGELNGRRANGSWDNEWNTGTTAVILEHYSFLVSTIAGI